MEETNQSRVRVNVNVTAKGLMQFDITSEFPTVEESVKNLDVAIKQCKETIKANGYQEVGA